MSKQITLRAATNKDLAALHKIQVAAFMPLLIKYNDLKTNPANETIEKLANRIAETYSDYYAIYYGQNIAGGIRVVPKENNRTRISPIYIHPIFQSKGIAQEAFKQVEQKYNKTRQWELDTIKQEKRNCYFYEKLGYCKTGEEVEINSGMTLVRYLKRTEKR
ncbi:GNAT family N-acetyltransferase [Viridibacillus sp. NPDC096237]|uniref:GNAT family N-acetyltransferase n=1 Tax=Viridibacillus sp. NPDC096237 TaxID=3390721 RepID=UPI003D058E23